MKLDRNFERKLKEAVLENAGQTLRDEVGPWLLEYSEERWRSYAAAHDYDIGFVWEDATLSVERSGESITMRVEWPELSALFEFGVSPHTIEGNPLLHFYWEAKDQWITTESVEWGSETGGIPESRAVRDSLNALRREL